MSWPAERWNLIPGDYILSVRSRLSTPDHRQRDPARGGRH